MTVTGHNRSTVEGLLQAIADRAVVLTLNVPIPCLPTVEFLMDRTMRELTADTPPLKALAKLPRSTAELCAQKLETPGRALSPNEVKAALTLYKSPQEIGL